VRRLEPVAGETPERRRFLPLSALRGLEDLQTMNQDSKTNPFEIEQDNRWIFGIVIGIGVAVALGSALDSVLLGIPIGIGAGLVFSAGLYRQGRRGNTPNDSE